MSDGSSPVRLTAGVDPGAAAVKVAIAKSRAGSEAAILALSVQRLRRRNVHDVARSAFDEALASAGVRAEDLDYVATTGDADAVDFRTGHFYSMTTHARGALHFFPEARAVLDAGALHARAIRMDDRGKVEDHRMTSQCASGTGQFLENISRYLGVPLEDVGTLSKTATKPERVSSICAVLSETDVINMVSRGVATPDIVKGIHLSIAGRLVQLLRAVGAKGTVVLTGGLAGDLGLVAALEETLAEDLQKRAAASRLTVRTHDHSVFAGAVGAALLGAYRRDQLSRSPERAAA